MADEFAPINTQEEFDTRVREIHGDVAGLQNQVQTLTADNAAKDTTINDLQSQVKKFQTDAMRMDVAKRKGIPAEMAKYLTGDDEKAMLASADTLSRELKAYKGPAPLHNPEPKNKDAKIAGLRNLFAQLKGE